MELSKITTGIIMVVVAVIMCSVLVFPVIEDVTATEETFTNDGYYYMTDNDDNYSLSYDSTTRLLNINGESFDFSTVPGGSYTIVSTNEFLIRIQNYASQNYVAWFITQTTRGNTPSFTFTANEGTATYLDNTYSYTSDSFYGISAIESDWTMCKYDGVNRILFDSQLTGNGTTAVNEWSDFFHIVGTLEDGVTLITSPNITITDAQVNATEVDGFIDLYLFESVTFTATGTAETPVNAVYNQIIIPSEVTAEYSNHLSSGEIAIMAVIPILLLVALVVVCARMISGRAD